MGPAAARFGLKAGAWHGPPLLKFLPAGAAHSVWFFRDAATDRFASWYVNLEEPGVRWDDGPVAGVDIVDQDLDVVVHADRSWSWKDEDEFAERLALPGALLGPRPGRGPRRGRTGDQSGRGGSLPLRRHLVRLHPGPRLAGPAVAAAGLGPAAGPLTDFRGWLPEPV